MVHNLYKGMLIFTLILNFAENIKMRNIIMILFAVCMLSACNSTQPAVKTDDGVHFGNKINSNNTISLVDLNSKMQGKEEMKAKVSGLVTSVCKKKGCWMTLKQPDGSDMRVTFKDYGFFVPKDCEGREAIIEGTAKIDVTDVETLRHYAEDQGQSAEEIAKITEPKKELVFVADGVILKE